MTEPRHADTLRADLLHALDFAYCSGVGYETPEQMLNAYDAARNAERRAPANPATEVERLQDEILDLRAEREKLRDLLRAEGARADAALKREDVAEEAVLEAGADHAAELRRMDAEAETGGAR